MVVGVPVVFHVQVPPAQVDVLASLVVQVSPGFCRGNSDLTIADRCQARVLDVERCM